MLVALIAVLISLVGQLSIIRLAMGPHVSVGEAIAHGGRRFLSYAGAVLVWTVPFMLIGVGALSRWSARIRSIRRPERRSACSP